jgi:hypothetical protein
MKVLCYFCQNEQEANAIAEGTVYKCVCDQCPEITSTVYMVLPDGKLQFWAASITFGDKGKSYSANYIKRASEAAELFYVDLLEVSEVDGKFQPSKRVMELSFLPKNITPHNIKEKFQTLKVWS